MFRGSKAFDHLKAVYDRGETECVSLPWRQSTIRFGGRSRPLKWAACLIANGAPTGDATIPISTCGIVGCINGRHYRWGTFADALAQREFPSRRGEANPNAKVTDKEVAQLRSVNWGTGYHKSQVIEAHGISYQTLYMILRGSCRESGADEF